MTMDSGSFHLLSLTLPNCFGMHCQYATEIATFLHKHPERNLSERKLYHILSLYEKWWIFIGQYRSEPFERYVMHYIAERTFSSNVQNSEYVAKVIVYLYHADKYLSFILCPDEIKRHFRSSSANSFDDYSIQIYHYFLRHAYKERLIIREKRILDLDVFCRSMCLHPCEMAVINDSPKLLHILLQYGALVTDGTTSTRRPPFSSNILMLIFCILKTIIRLFNQNPWECEEDLQYSLAENMIMCGKLVLRTTPQLEQSKVRQLKFQGYSSARQAMAWATDYALGELSHRIYHPISLKHACRLKIRKVLYDNWQLPGGIEQFPLPNMVKNYLNLYYD